MENVHRTDNDSVRYLKNIHVYIYELMTEITREKD